MKRVVIATVTVLGFLMLEAQTFHDLSQERISIEVSRVPASTVLEMIGRQLGLKISYNSNFLEDRLLSLKTDTATVPETLAYIFQKEEIHFQVIGNQLAIYDPSPVVNVEQCYRSVRGIVIDDATHDALRHISIVESLSNQHVVTNSDGKFLLRLPCETDSLNLTIRALGYKTHRINIPVAKDIGELRLVGDYVSLQEVVVLSLPAKKLLHGVLENISENYLTDPTNATSFFREAVLKNRNLAKLSEAVFQVYNSPYDISPPEDQVRLLKGRKFVDRDNVDTVSFKIKGSLKSCFDLDIVKHQPDFFHPELFEKQYDYVIRDVVGYENHNIYVIDFERNFHGRGLPYQGTMYVDGQTLALRSVEFELRKTDLPPKINPLVIKKGAGSRTTFKWAKYRVNYTEVSGKLIMNYVSLRTKFRVRRKKNLFAADYETLTEYMVNSFVTENVSKIRDSDNFSKHIVFMDQPVLFDPGYWGGLSYLPIDQPLIESSKRLEQIILQ